MTFKASLQAALSSRGIEPKTFCDFSNIAELTILKEYGAVYLADFFTQAVAAAAGASVSVGPFPFSPVVGEVIRQSIAAMQVKIPPKCIFANSKEVEAFQSSALTSVENIGGTTIELQTKAMLSLKEAEAEVKDSGGSITPRQGATSGKRSYANTVEFWNKRITDGVAYWTKKANKKGEKLSSAEGDELKKLTGKKQIEKVLELEQKGFWFSTYKNKTILRSVAAPGTSQHLLMLALDVKEYTNKKVRAILAKHGWFQTVYQDHPHFTYLGMPESALNSLGLTKITESGQDFYVPNI